MRKYGFYLLSILLMFCFASVKASEKIGQFYYYLDKINNEAKLEKTDITEGEVVIPSSVSFEGEDYVVNEIWGQAFADKTEITSFIIPNTIEFIGYETFLNCKKLTSITLPKSLKRMGGEVYDLFNGCDNLMSIEVEEGNTEYMSINGALCSYERDILYVVPNGVTSFTIPKTISYVFGAAFKNCDKLKKIDIESGNTSSLCVEDGVLYKDITNSNKITSRKTIILRSYELIKVPNAIEIDNFIIQKNVVDIDNYAMYGCKNINLILIPSSVKTIGYNVFGNNSKLEKIYSFCKFEKVEEYVSFKQINSKTKIYCLESEFDNISKYWNGELYNIGSIIIGDCSENIFEISFSIEDPKIEGFPLKVSDVLYGKSGSETEMETLNQSENGRYVVKTEPSNVFDFKIDFSLGKEQISYSFKKSTEQLSFYYDRSAGQTYLEWKNFRLASNDTSSDIEIGVYRTKQYPAKDGIIKVENLVPNCKYLFSFYAICNGKYYYTDERVFSTLGTNPRISWSSNSTTINCSCSKTIEDATVKEEYITVGKDKYPGNKISLDGLHPDRKYIVEYTVITNEGSTEKATANILTDPLEFKILQPSCVSNTCAILAAETNIDEKESDVGFEWRKYDAPETLPSNVGYAAIYEGRLEGYVRNLQSAFYYNVRAFYKTSDGTYYYTNWTTFDPSDFSYFEPTVHTYPADDVTDRTATVKGYAIAGTDEIIEQGFEYWPIYDSTKKIVSVTTSTRADEDKSVVISSGQIMTAKLENLAPLTTYVCCAYVKTINGIMYGEEQTFTTLQSTSGIVTVEKGKQDVVVTGYYDLNGRKLNAPQQGIIIVRYSDGTTRKIIVK